MSSVSKRGWGRSPESITLVQGPWGAGNVNVRRTTAMAVHVRAVATLLCMGRAVGVCHNVANPVIDMVATRSSYCFELCPQALAFSWCSGLDLQPACSFLVGDWCS